jgi:hypothetical protein
MEELKALRSSVKAACHTDAVVRPTWPGSVLHDARYRCCLKVVRAGVRNERLYE